MLFLLEDCHPIFNDHHPYGTPQYLFYFNPRYNRAADEYAPYPVPPEFRLEPAILAAPLFVISFFWFG